MPAHSKISHITQENIFLQFLTNNFYWAVCDGNKTVPLLRIIKINFFEIACRFILLCLLIVSDLVGGMLTFQKGNEKLLKTFSLIWFRSSINQSGVNQMAEKFSQEMVLVGSEEKWSKGSGGGFHNYLEKLKILRNF